MERTWKSYFIELFIVIIGVSIAFWLGQLAQERRDDVVRENYLTDIQSDLRSDIKKLDYAIKFNANKVKVTDSVAALFANADDHRDVIIDQIMQLGNYNFFQPESFTYESMIASGDFKLLKDREIKKDLLKLYSRYQEIENLQDNWMQALDDNYFPFVMLNFDYTTWKTSNPEFHKELLIKNFFSYSINDLGIHVSYYKYVKKSANKLDSLISVKLQ